MITCPYCGSELNDVYENQAECTFCEIQLGPDSEFGNYAMNGQRVPHVQQNHIITEDHAALSLPGLKKMHPMDLILCLRIARQQRAEWYNHMRTFNKASEDPAAVEEQEHWKHMADQTGRDYEYWTRKCWMIENLLIEKVGYFPEKINEELYSKFVTHNVRSVQKPMKISKVKRH